MNLDIIIPIYNAKKTLKRLLYSITISKNIEGTNVFLVNDASSESYDEEINFFKKFISIKELKLYKNFGPGMAREFGINNSNSKYIIFIDADDYFYAPDSISKLYLSITNNNSDLVISNFLYKRDNETKIIKKNNVWLHGKIYKRSFLKNNDIHFNDTYYNEDNGFNRLCLFCNPNIFYLDDITYVYYDNYTSITRKDDRLYKFTGLEWYTYNINWAIKETIKRNIKTNDIAYVALGTLVSMYYYYLELYEYYDITKILKWSYETKCFFDEYNNGNITFSVISKFLKNKEEEYKDKDINNRITFFEFLNRIDGVLNDRCDNTSL